MSQTFDIAEDELQILLADIDEHLQMLDEGLIRLEQAGHDPQLLQAVFRAAHTLKGIASVINHWQMADLTHALETVLDGLRKGTLAVTPTLVDTCLEALDVLKLLCGEIREGAPSASALEVVPLVTRLLAFSKPPHPGARTPSPRTADHARAPVPPPTEAAAAGHFVRADISPESVAPAARALQIVLTLQALGTVTDLQPPRAVIEMAAPVRRVTARLQTSRPIEEIRQRLSLISEVAGLVIDDEIIHLTPEGPNPLPHVAPEAPLDPSDEPVMRVGEFLRQGGYITAAQLQIALEKQAADPSGRRDLLGHILVEMGAVTWETLNQAAAQQTQQLRTVAQAMPTAPPEAAPSTAGEKTVRTSVERLDHLMNLVGELITDRNRLNQVQGEFESRSHNHELVETLAQTVVHLSRITDQLQEEVMRIRMLPIANLFNKFPRLVRDVARELGKQVELVSRGEDTELDRSVIEAIRDPLIHLVRNAVAHGLETPEERLAAGKSERGVVLLTARHEESRIILTVEDDGRGIDLKQVRASALRKGLVSEAEVAALTREETLELIFRPGLSTAEVVNNVSGRGVGMDIVRANIERLNGNILVETWPGQGTRFQIVLPLTLAIIPTLLVQAGENTLALPLIAVMETIRLPVAGLRTANGRLVTQLRGRVLPLVRLSEVLGLPRPPVPQRVTYEYIVAVRWGKLEMGLIVDRLVGEQEVVIKSLGALIGDTPGISGAAILGDGRLALIADVAGLFKLVGAKMPQA
jgi:two-component system chemotaxis sensor kinase CheA